jgi:plastocyanin
MILAALAGAMCLLHASPAMAAAVDILVLDPDGDPVPDVVVYAVGGTSRPPSGKPAIMDQVDTRFVPHVLAIQKGTAVDFPNSDVVAHHVYSFSKPNDFVLPLYKGDPHEPVTFNYDGVVTLGCNIHDQMLAYIVVVDTDRFGMTNALGRLTLDFGPDVTAVSIWSPRFRDRDSALTRELAVTDSAIVFQLQKKLLPAYESGADAIQWSDY